jgi:SAM-dependent methyltransferase
MPRARELAKSYARHTGDILAALGRYALAGSGSGLANGGRALAALATDIVDQVSGPPPGVSCPLCGWSGRRFGPMYYFDHYREDARCYGCGTTDRSRAFKAFVDLELATELSGGQKRVLDIGPVPGSRNIFPPDVQYISFDLYAPIAMVKGDITAMPFASAFADLWLCSHVLDVVPDDGAAMRELFRVLAPGGIGILDNVMDWDKPTEEYGEARRGECGHLRRYGSDLPDKLRAVGFEVRLVEVSEVLPPELRRRHGIGGRRLVVVRRPRRVPA